MSQFKIIFTGPEGAGKTTAISSISDVAPLKTDFSASVKSTSKQASSVVAMDYGVMDLEDGEKIHLYGTSGQKYLDFEWDILINGGIGLVLLLDNTQTDPFKDMWFFLDAFKSFIKETGVVIGVTKMDLSGKPTIEDYHYQLQLSELKPPVFAVDTRQKNDVFLLIQALLYSLDPGLVE